MFKIFYCWSGSYKCSTLGFTSDSQPLWRTVCCCCWGPHTLPSCRPCWGSSTPSPHHFSCTRSTSLPSARTPRCTVSRSALCWPGPSRSPSPTTGRDCWSSCDTRSRGSLAAHSRQCRAPRERSDRLNKQPVTTRY